MKLSSAPRRRVEAIVVELQEVFGSNVGAEGRAKTFEELEDECVEVGDWLTSQVLQRRVVTGGTTDEAPRHSAMPRSRLAKSPRSSRATHQSERPGRSRLCDFQPHVSAKEEAKQFS